jgi:hypothetical protein|tara:strand:+ start:142 stop:891 length:750 start_codon:yes stop_codon:yes gene_type:complete
MNEEDLKDETSRKLSKIERLIKEKEVKEENFYSNNEFNDKLTVRTFSYQEIQIEKFDKLIEQEIKELLNLFENNSDFLEMIISEALFDDYERETYSLFLKELVKKPRKWKNILEKEFIDGLNNFKEHSDDIEFWDRFVSIGNEIPENLFDIESKFYQKLIFELNSQNPCIIYWATIILWEKGYTNQITVEAFKKNLNHQDWRIRVITHECLETWINEKEIDLKKLNGLSFKDRKLRKFRSDYESKLLAP